METDLMDVELYKVLEKIADDLCMSGCESMRPISYSTSQ